MSEVRYWASRAFVYTNAQNGLPALPPEIRFCLLGQRPKPFEQPLAGAGCAFGNQTLMLVYLVIFLRNTFWNVKNYRISIRNKINHFCRSGHCNIHIRSGE